MLSRDSEDKMWCDLCLNLWYDLKRLLCQDELNPRVRCAFGNVCFFICCFLKSLSVCCFFYVNWLAFTSRHWVQIGPNLCWLQAKMDWTGSRVGKCWGDILWSTARGTWPTLLMSRCQSGIWTSPRGSSFEKVSLSNTWELTIVHVDKKDASQPETQLSCWKHHLAVSWTEQCSCKSGWPRFSLDCSSPATHKTT